MDRYSKSFCLQICPKNSNCLRLTFLIKDLVTFASFNTESFVLFSVHDILIILLISHISVASIFKTLLLVVIDMFLFISIGFILWNVSLAIAILFLTSVSHLPSDVIAEIFKFGNLFNTHSHSHFC
ncbi:hypothetical protein GQR58_000832 [Nymphon striatum]|nr:hypothetical protein GQR58_000832 [Nymphon striatum]